MKDMTSPAPAAIGVDIGTTNTKVVLARFNGERVGEERVRTLPTPPEARRLREAVLAAMREVADGERDRLYAIGVASLAETGAVVGLDGEPRGALLRWNDDAASRAAAEHLVASTGVAALYAATGVPVAAKSPLAHWAALAQAGDSRIDGARWSGVADLLVEALTGEAVTDHTLAARTMAYRLATGGETPAEFDDDLLALAGLSRERFPRVARPGEPAGELSAPAASALGLPSGLPVVVAGHDHAVGAWAAGVREPGRAADSVGTAEALYRVAATVPLEEAGRQGMSVARTVDGRHESLLAGNPMAGAFVEWAFTQLLPGADREAALAGAARLVEASAGPWPSFVLPYPRGRQAPTPDTRAHVRAVPALPADPAEAVASVLAGLALQLAWLDAEQSRLLGERRPELAVLGGPGAGNDAWWLLKQRVLPGRLRRVAAAAPVATGAAMLAMRRVAGADSVLPVVDGPGAPEPDSDGDPDLLARFVAEATHHEKEMKV